VSFEEDNKAGTMLRAVFHQPKLIQRVQHPTSHDGIVEITINAVTIIGMVFNITIVAYFRLNGKIRAIKRVQRHYVSRVKGIIPNLNGWLWLQRANKRQRWR
jgi:hypothetical protein